MIIKLIGDISFNGLISEDDSNNKVRFENISEILAKNDLIFANLEGPLYSGKELNENKKLHVSSDPDIAKKLLVDLNFCGLSLANNHILDYKEPGLKSTIDILDDLDIFHTGAGLQDKHIRPALIERFGIKIGFFAYVDLSTNPGYQSREDLYLNIFQIDEVKNEINEIRDVVDLVIFSIHWGKDYSHYPTLEQMTISRELVEAGVDIIMGHHSHAAQPFEEYKGKLIFYGLGSLTYGDDLWNGKLRALRIKTKFSFIPVIEYRNKSLKIINGIETRELRGNFLELGNVDYLNWSKKKMRITRLVNKNLFVKYLVTWKELYFDKYYDFFFGYYRNPISELLNPTNYKHLFNKIINSKN